MRRADQVSKHQSVATGEPCTWITCTHGSEGGGGDGAARQPRRPPTLLAVSAQNTGLFVFRNL